MPETTLTINHADGGSETYTINRDKFEGVRSMDTIPQVLPISGLSEGNGVYKRVEDYGGKPSWRINGNGTIPYGLFYYNEAGLTWMIARLSDNNVVTSSTEDIDNPWEITSWSLSVPVIDASASVLSVDRTEPEDIRTLLMDGQTITIDTSAEGIRTLTIDGQEVTIDRSDEVEIIRFVEEFGQPSAAFSLRRLSTDYTGPAVRIRRESDDAEVNAVFDTTGVVSANSAITNVEDFSLISESGFVADTGGFESSISGANFSFGNTLDGKSNVLFATFDGSGLLGLNFSTSDVAIGDVVVYSFDIYWESTNIGELPDLRIRSGNTTIGHTDVSMPSKDSWYTFSGQFTVTSNTPAALTLAAVNSSGLTTGDIFAIANGSYAKQQDAGDTTATTLGGFLTEELTAYSSDFTTTDGWAGDRAIITANVDANADGAGVPPSDDFLKMVADPAQSPPRLSLRGNTNVRNYVIGAGGGDFEVTFDYYAPQDISVFKVITFTGSGNPQFGDSNQIVTGSGSWSTTVTLTDDQATTLTDLRVGSTTDQTGKTLYIKNLKIKRSNHGAYVQTWYDQSGNSNDATQDIADSQPKLAEAGALLADGVNFDGVDDFFTASGVSTTQPYSVFMKIKASETGSVQQIIDSDSADPAFFQLSTAGVLSINNPTSTITSLDLTSTPTNVLISGFIDDPKTAFANGASILSPVSGTGTNSLSGLTIGKHRTVSTSYFSGNFSELVIYNSDQSSNRSGIESNIADHYGITLP